jgi:hypothetical protein
MGNPSQGSLSVSSYTNFQLGLWANDDDKHSPNTCELPAAVTLAAAHSGREAFPLHILGPHLRKIPFRM